MAAGEEIVRISYAQLESIVLSTHSDQQRTGEHKSVKHPKSRRPAQQIYRPGQLRQTKEHRLTFGNEESWDTAEGKPAAGEEQDWEIEDLNADSTDEDKGKESREGSREIGDRDINQRLDDLYIDSPPRELEIMSYEQAKSGQYLHYVHTSGRYDDRRSEAETAHAKRRGKRPDIQIYIPKGRLGERDNRSEERDGTLENSVSPKTEGNKILQKLSDQEPCDEVIVHDSVESPRKVHVKHKGGSMQVTVINELPTSGTEHPPTVSQKEIISTHQKKQVQNYELAESEIRKKQTNKKESEQKNKQYQQENVKGAGSQKSHENNVKANGKSDYKCMEVLSGEETRKQVQRKQERPVKSYSKNRRSNSSDSRLAEQEQNNCKFRKEHFTSDTFPRAKGPSKAAGTAGREVFPQGKGGKEAKGNCREGEKFYWGMRRQRTGSISSEASMASNPSNGSFYSGSSDFTEDDEPEHILNWGEEVEKAHLEELARLVHDGAQKLTSSLDVYPTYSQDTVPSSNKKTATTVPVNESSADATNKAHQCHVKEGRTRRRNRQRKNSSHHGSRDSSVHNGVQGDNIYSDASHRRRRRRRNSHGSQASYEQQHQHFPQKVQQHCEDEHVEDNSGESSRGRRSGLQVTVGHNNRHVEISRVSGFRQRHRSDEKWDPHVVKDYDVDDEEEHWDTEIDYNDDTVLKKAATSRQFGPQKWEKNVPPRFRKDSGGTGGRGRRNSGGNGIRDSESYRHQGNRDDESQGQDVDRCDSSDVCWQQKDTDQRAVHPAHDATGTSHFSIQGRGRALGRALGRGHGWKHSHAVESRGAAGHTPAHNQDDLAIAHSTHAGGLLHLPAQVEPPRPHSNPNPAIHADHSFHHHNHDSHHSGPGIGPTIASNTRGLAYGKRQLFDPKNPSTPILVSDTASPAAKFEDTDRISTAAGTGGISSSPESGHVYPAAFYPAVYGFRLPMPHFPPPANPYMAGFPTGSIPPHIFYRFPRMAALDLASFYSSSDLDSEGMMSVASKAQCRLMAEQILRDCHPFDSQLGNILSRHPHSEDSLRMMNQIRAELQSRLEQVMLLDIEVASKHNVEQMLWKSVYYQVMESYRKKCGEQSQDGMCKQRLIEILDEGTRFFENLLKKLQSCYEFDLELFTDGNRPILENVNRNVKLALLSAQRVMMFLGDIARYREQSSDTTNYGKARHWYLKAQRIHPRNGRPYNQLAILAVYTRRKLDAVYYYMRSLAASNPILTARESLVSLFDEVRKKVDVVEKKRFEERRQRQALKRKRQSRGPRVEIWVLPDGTSTQDRVREDEDDEDLSSLSAIELNKRFVLTYLNVHGKLFTKINFEVFAESSSLMLQEFQMLIQHSPCVFSSTRLLQLMVINMFSIENTALKDESLEDSCRSLLQEHAVETGLDMFGLLVKRSSELLSLQLESHRAAANKGIRDKNGRFLSEEDEKSACEHVGESPVPVCPSVSSVLDEDLHIMLPALKTWVDWMMCHAHLWNPQPLNRPPELGPHIDVWKNLAAFCDLLNSVETKPGCLIREQKPGYEPVMLHEDTTLAGFVPMLSAPQEIFFADSSIEQQQAEDWLRIEKLRLFGEYLCGVDPPLLAFNVESGRYYSVAASPSRSEEKLVTDGVDGQGSGDESDDVIIEHDDSEDDRKSLQEKDDIDKLKAKKADLRRQRAEREKNKENMEAILDSHRYGKIELEICPIFLVTDTNCFIDHFSTLKKILQTKKYTLVVPLVVINELDGLTRGARDHQYDSPDHAHMVKCQAQAAIEFLQTEFEHKNTHLRAQTSKGSILETIAFTSEESDSSGVNDDIILNCCLHYCKDMAREFMPRDRDQPVRLYREVVLLTDDRNLRLKAHTCNVPVKDVPSFKKWSKIP
ncbi:hypothetical protein BsWGS_21657 [Bradybaena similaris]